MGWFHRVQHKEGHLEYQLRPLFIPWLECRITHPRLSWKRWKKNSMFVKCVRTGDLCQFFIAPGMEILSELTTNRSKSCCVSIFGSWLRLKMAYTPEKWNSEKKSTAWKIDLGIPHSLTNPCAL